MRLDVSRCCRTCHTCQVKGRLGPGVPLYPLIPIPVVSEPLSRLITDCVGPLLRLKRGNQYLLTIIDSAIRSPKAIPLRNITTKNVVKALFKFFTRFGLPTKVQSDQVFSFTSGLFEEVIKSLGIKQYPSTANYPQSQGVVEKFHYTLKTVMTGYCLDMGSELYDGTDHLLSFSVRAECSRASGIPPSSLYMVIKLEVSLNFEKVLARPGRYNFCGHLYKNL